MRKNILRKGVSCLASAAMVAMMVPAVGVGSAAAATTSSDTNAWWSSFEPTAVVTPGSLVTTYGVRAGSAGGDYVGVSNTNFDFTAAGAKAESQYTGYVGTSATDKTMAGLAIWGSSANESANPYYANLFYSVVNPTASVSNKATTWSKNPDSSSWGDSLDTVSNAGMEWGGPSIVFGASKTAGWTGSQSANTNFGTYDANSTTFNPTYVNNDATNIWTQVYTMGELASAADGVSGKTTRYGSASASALNYEKAIRGNMLYVASQIANESVDKKTVAYLYAIDNNYAYFFTPQASQMTSGDDTGKAPDESATEDEKKAAADDNYAANNGTVDLGYMATLPYITNTFSAGTSIDITMKVEDIYKKNPACKVALGDLKQTLNKNKVDVLIYNTNTALTEAGTSAGKNSDGIVNASPLTSNILETYLPSNGKCQLLAGDDYGTSTKQNADISDQAPLLYCQRNYTADKNARAAWAFSKVYPELYQNKADSSYANWVRDIYHIKDANVNGVVAYMTNQESSDVQAVSESDIQSYFETGYNWWNNLPSSSSWKTTYATYTGSTRASYYGAASAELDSENVIGIFQPSNAWRNATHGTAGTGLVKSAKYAIAAGNTWPTSEEDAQVYKGLKWWEEGSDEAGNRTLHLAAAPTDSTDCHAGELVSGSSCPWAVRGAVRQYTAIVVHEGVTRIEAAAALVMYGTNACTFKSISLPSSLIRLGDRVIYGANGVSKDFTLTIGGVDATSYAESQLRYLGVLGNMSSTFATEYTEEDGDYYPTSGTDTLKVYYPETAEVADGAFQYLTDKGTAVPYGKHQVAVPSIDNESFDYDGAEKSVKVTADDVCAVSGTTAAKDAGAYAVSVSLPNTKYYEWADKDEAAAKVFTWSIVEKAKDSTPQTLPAQDLCVGTSNKVVKCKKGKKKLVKAVKTKKVKVTGAKGKVSYAKVAKGSSKKLSIAKNGKITVKKGTKKGSYKINVKVSAAATSAYCATSSTVTITVVVK